MVYPYLKLHILFNGNGLAIWSSFPDISHIKKKKNSVGILPNFELIQAISDWMNGIHFGAIHKKVLSE